MGHLYSKGFLIFFNPIKKILILLFKFYPYIYFQLREFFQIPHFTTIKIKSKDGLQSKFLYFRTENDVSYWRTEVFHTKEPETINWIRNLSNGVFFDIGANIGQYAILFAQLHQGQVYCFEPSPDNYLELIENINLNKMEERIKVFPIALSDKNTWQTFSLINSKSGSSENQILESISTNITRLKDEKWVTIRTFSLDNLLMNQIITDFPNYIKIDVDGNENKIISGAALTLSNNKLQSILLEINKNVNNSYISKTLKSFNFRLSFEGNSDLIQSSTSRMIYNQIWVR